MPFRTQTFNLFPWLGGLNTSLDESTIPSNQLTVADHITMDVRPSKRKRDGIDHAWDDVTSGTVSIIGLHDYWYGTSSKTQRIIGVGNNRTIKSYTTGGVSTSLTESNKSITDISVANPTVITSAAHGLTTGDQITISGSNSTPSVDGSHSVTVTGTNTFTIPVNVTVQGTTGTWVSRTWSGTLTQVSMKTFNNRTVICTDGTNNMPKLWDGTTFSGLLGNPPAASIVNEHFGRLFTNDKTNVDRLHFSPVHDHTTWQGKGDSGAFDVGTGDGDPDGITAIFPTFKGNLFVAKRTKLYRIITPSNNPAEWIVELISSSIGCTNHNSVVPIGQDDVFFMSERGIHSLAATANYGDFESTFVSTDIQKTFRDTFAQSRLKYSAAAYDSSLNSVAFCVTESSMSNADTTKSTSIYGTALTTSKNNAIYLYNIQQKAWYRWGGTAGESIVNIRDSSDSKQRFLLGTHISRISRTKNGTNYDLSHGDVIKSIAYKINTGYIFPDGNPYQLKAFKRLILYYKPMSSHNITVNVKIDNQTVGTENQLSFSQSQDTALLGSTFTLGSSTLGYSRQMGPYSQSIMGVGRSIKIEIIEDGTTEPTEIQGIGIEWEPLAQSAEVF